MIYATKVDVDGLRDILVARLEDLNAAVRQWVDDPTNPDLRSTASRALEVAYTEFDNYDSTIRNWAAGPSGGDGA